LIRADQSSRLSHELVDGTACRFRVSPVHSALYVVVIEMPTACDRDSLQAKQQHHQHQHQREQQRRDSADARSGDARRDSFRSVDSTPVSTIGSSSLRTRSSDSDADDADLVVDEFRQLSVSGGCGATSAYLRNRFGATPNELATVSNRRRSEVDDTAGTSGGRRRSLASEQQRRALKGFATTFDQSSSRRRDNVSPAAAVKPITPLNVPLTTASLSTSGVTLRGAQSGRALLRNSTESNNGATTTTLPRSNSASSLRSTAAATTSGVGRPTVAAAQSYAIAGFSSGETTRALAHSGGVKNAGYSHRRNALKTMSGGGGGDNKGSDEQYAARTSPPTTPRAGATASAAAAASAATSTGSCFPRSPSTARRFNYRYVAKRGTHCRQLRAEHGAGARRERRHLRRLPWTLARTGTHKFDRLRADCACECRSLIVVTTVDSARRSPSRSDDATTQGNSTRHCRFVCATLGICVHIVMLDVSLVVVLVVVVVNRNRRR
jgi:hypothetical protein